MARDSKIEVAAINIRIPGTANRDYSALIELLSKLKRGVRVYGESYVAISFYNKNAKWGIISKYTEIDIDGEWFDLDDFDVATTDKVNGIAIPESLKPNLAQFYFSLNQEMHIFAFSTYSESRGLSARSMEKYFKESLSWEEVVSQFGRVESDIVKSYDQVDRLLSLPELKELSIIINRPNPDDVSENLADIIEKRLAEQNSDQYEETLKAKGANNIIPNERTKELAIVAAENGSVKTKSIVNGVLKTQDTEDKPLTEVVTYKPSRSERTVFFEVVGRLLEKVRAARASLNG